MSKNSAVNAKIARSVVSKRIEKPTKTENRDAVKEKSVNSTVTTSSKKAATVTATKKVSNSQNVVAKPQIVSKTVVTKPKPAAPTASMIKPKIISTAANKVSRPQPIRAIHQVQAKKPVAEKNVMNTIHNVTVASPPSVRKEHTIIQQSMEILPRPLEPVKTQQSIDPLPRERTKTRTLGPEEAILLKLSTSDQKPVNLSEANTVVSSEIEQKPLKIHDPVAYEITFEKPVTSSSTENIKPPPDISEEAEYEDDFDSYESDFETESSSASQTASTSSKSEDESANSVPSPSVTSPISPPAKKVDDDRDFDSGTYELKGSAEKVQLDSIDERELHSEGQTDSGFGYNNATPSPIDQIISMSSTVFSKPLIKPSYNKRGMELMKKINLDTMTFTLFELKPLSYDLYMKIYGHKNTNQNSSQTMGNMVDQDVQTENKAKQSMWTQYPPNFVANVSSDETYHQDRIGCGEGFENVTYGQSSDECRLESSLKIINRTNVLRDVRSTKPIDFERLNFFLQKSAITVSAICETSASTKDLHKSDSAFSDGFFRISIDKVEILNNTAVYYMYSNPTIENLVYLAHRQRSTTRTHDASLVSVWNVLDTKKPVHVLACWSLIICLEVHHNFQDVVIGGLTDGCVAVWNCNESTLLHQSNNQGTLPPSHIVSPSLDTKPISFDFGCVISLKSMHQVNGINDDGFKLTQICSLHEFGMVTVWTILHTNSHSTNLDIYNERRIDHRSPWSKVQLVQSSIIDLTSMNLNNRKARPKSGFDKKKMYFESNLFNDAALRELHDIDARKDLSDQSEKFRCVDMEYHEDGIVIATNKSFVIFVATSLNRDSLRKVFIDESNLLHATKLKSLDDILLVGLTDGSVKVLRVSSSNVCRKSSDIEPKTVTGLPFDQHNFNAKSCAIQNIIKEERKKITDDPADRLKQIENVIDGADMVRGNRLINNQVLLPAMSLNRDFVRWMDVSVSLNCLMSLCGERFRIINFESTAEDRVGDGSNNVAFAAIVLGYNQREYLVNVEQDNVRVHLLRKKII
ncbi:hypothetical protein HA402_006107 [Bradysia odoriphaga]|nr:hypothetical protein HA402_006107 [Bradysia odoriphaga]